jgi:hypothetical protein
VVLSAHEIEEQVKNFHLRFLPLRDERIEWGMKLPMFVDTFNFLIAKNSKVPSQDEFVDAYFQDNASGLTNVLSNQTLREGLEARLRRTYPSLVRDIHFESLLRENGLDVTHDPHSDVFGGVDHVINYQGHVFHIHCYVDTRAGRYGRRIKNRRHDFQGIHLNVPMTLDAQTSKSVGDFYLYSEKHVDYLLELMKDELEKLEKPFRSEA